MVRMGSALAGISLLAGGIALLAGGSAARAAEPVMVQCGREYQAARTAGTLNGADWNRYRTDCAARLKAAPVAPAAAPAPGPVTAAPQVAAAPAVAATPAVAGAPQAAPMPAAAAPSGGMAAMHGRQKRCGAEWTAQKAALVAATPGLTWPRYWSLCNTRLKAAGG